MAGIRMGPLANLEIPADKNGHMEVQDLFFFLPEDETKHDTEYR